MAAAYRWRRRDLVDFGAGETSAGYVPSARLAAGGVFISRGRLAANDGVEIGAAQLVVAVIESSPVEIEWRLSGDDKLRRHCLLPNSAQIVPAGFSCHSRWSARPTIFSIAFDGGLIDALRRDFGRFDHEVAQARLALRDPEIDLLVSRLRLELDFGGWSGRRYLEALGLVLAGHLVRAYGGGRARTAPRGGLGASLLLEVAGYIDAHLGEEITLASLARLAGLSPHHFASAFRRTAGVAPHRYLLERRIARACELLAKSETSVTTVAHALGFASHGHFSESFRRFIGVTPSTFRTQSQRVMTRPPKARKPT